jgi:ankyrin repeat protein
MSEDYPFMDYAVNNLFIHAKMAELSGYDQTYLTAYFHSPTDECFKSWICLHDLRNFNVGLPSDGPDTSLMHITASNGITTCLRTLLEIGVDSKAVGGLYENALLAASVGGHIEAVKLLLNYGAAGGINGEGEDILEAATYLAACSSHEQVAELLLTYDFDVNAQTDDGRTPLHEACLNGNLSLVRMLIDKGANLTIKDEIGLTALHEASWSGDLKVVTWLIEKGASVEEIDDAIATPLHCAAIQGHEAVAEILLNNGAKLESMDGDAQTPLHLAVMGGHEQTTTLLLAKGINPMLQDTKGRTALHRAAAVGSSPNVALLTQRGDISAFVDCVDDLRMTALHIAAREGHKLVAQMLVEGGATIGLHERVELTALHWAISFGHELVVEYLLQKEADLGIRVVLEDFRGRDALYHAVTNNELMMVKELLVRYGATVQEQDSLGNAFRQASIRGNTTIIQLLLEGGAQIDYLSVNGDTALHQAAR